METQPFRILDCSLIALATGKSARTLRELRDHLQTIHPDSIYYHFWSIQLRPLFDNPDYKNDFAAWAREGLNDKTLAEKLAMIDPDEFSNIEELRRELIEIIEERIDQTEGIFFSQADKQFFFNRSQLIVIDTRIAVNHPSEFINIIPKLSSGAIFYHFIDSRRRTHTSKDDFSLWLESFGDEFNDLINKISDIDPYFLSLIELKEALVAIFKIYFSEKEKDYANA